MEMLKLKRLCTFQPGLNLLYLVFFCKQMKRVRAFIHLSNETLKKRSVVFRKVP